MCGCYISAGIGMRAEHRGRGRGRGGGGGGGEPFGRTSQEPRMGTDEADEQAADDDEKSDVPPLLPCPDTQVCRPGLGIRIASSPLHCFVMLWLNGKNGPIDFHETGLTTAREDAGRLVRWMPKFRTSAIDCGTFHEGKCCIARVRLIFPWVGRCPPPSRRRQVTASA